MLYHLAANITDNTALRAAGYDWLAGEGLVRCQTSGGPAGAGGSILADQRHTDAARCRYEPDGQEWLPTDCPGLHVGRWHDLPMPTPEQLAREDQLDGHAVELADGNAWTVPVARGYVEQDGDLRWYCALPQRLDWRGGEWHRGEVLPRYAHLWSISERWEERWAAGFAMAVAAAAGEDGGEAVAVELSLTDAADLAVEVLAVNYRITAAEVSLLGLFADATPAAVLDAVIDLPTRRAWIKKKLPPDHDSASTSDGIAG